MKLPELMKAILHEALAVLFNRARHFPWCFIGSYVFLRMCWVSDRMHLHISWYFLVFSGCVARLTRHHAFDFGGGGQVGEL